MTEVAVGSDFSCGLKSNGYPVCWGDEVVYDFTTVPSEPMTNLRASALHGIALDADLEPRPWGMDRWRSEGFGLPDGPFIDVSAGVGFSCGLLTSGEIDCWAYSLYPDYDQADAPAGVFTSITSSKYHSCALREDGTVACWGSNHDDKCEPPEDVRFKSISAGGDHSCGVTTEDEIRCWGWDGYGATTVPAGTFKMVSSGDGYACAVTTDHRIRCWGLMGGYSDRDKGQLDPPFAP